MGLFLVERYAPAGTGQLLVADVGRANRASGDLEAEGVVARLVSSTLVPEDETCFVLFAAPSAREVRVLLDRAELPYHRIVEAVQIAVAAPQAAPAPYINRPADAEPKGGGSD